jgi:cyanophycinase
MYELDALLLTDRPKRVIHIPTAAGREGEGRLGYWRNLALGHFSELGAEVETLDVTDRPGAMRQDQAARIAGVGMIFMSGGDPHHLVESLRNTPVWEAMRAAWDSGAVLAGCSAGAMALGGAIPAFRREAGEALGLIPGISVIPHYDRYGKMMKPIVQLRERRITVVGIDENTAMYGGPDVWTAYGSGAIHVFDAGEVTIVKHGERVDLSAHDR